MSSLYTYPISLHNFKYVGNDTVALSHEFRYIFQAFIEKHRQQIFLSEIEIEDISKQYVKLYMNKIIGNMLKQHSNLHIYKATKEISMSKSKFADKEIDCEVIKEKNLLGSNINKDFISIAKNKKNRLLNDFDKEIKFINVYRSKLAMKIPDEITNKNKAPRIFGQNFERQVVFINKINNHFRYLENINKLSMLLNINHNRKVFLVNMGYGSNSTVGLTKALCNTRIVSLINARRSYAKSLHAEIRELIKGANNEKAFDKFISNINIRNNDIHLDRVQMMSEINKVKLIRRYLNMSFNEMIRRSMNKKYLVKQNTNGVYVYNHKYLTASMRFILKSKKSFKYLKTVHKNINKITTIEKYLNNAIKNFSRLKNNRNFIDKNFSYGYKHSINEIYLKKHIALLHKEKISRKYMCSSIRDIDIKSTHRKFLFRSHKYINMIKCNSLQLNGVIIEAYKDKSIVKELSKSYKDIIVHYNALRYFNKMSKSIIKRSNNTKLNKTWINGVKLGNSYYLKKTYLMANLLKSKFINKKEKPNLWKVSNIKGMQTGKEKIYKVNMKFFDKNTKKVVKNKKSMFYDKFVIESKKMRNIIHMLNKTSEKSITIKKQGVLVSKPPEVIKSLNNSRLLIQKAEKIDRTIIDNRLLTALRHHSIFKTDNSAYFSKALDNRYYYQKTFKGLDKTWTRINIIKNITKFLEIKRRWWILEHNELTDKLIIPNIDYPYETEPVMGIDKHPISSILNIDYKDIDYGNKEIEVSIEIMQQMLNMLFVLWNGAYYEFEKLSTTEAIEKVMEVYYAWINIEQVKTEMTEKGSREDYLRIYRWFRWEAEKVWIQEKEDIDNNGVKSIGMLVANIIEYMKIHHYNLVPITNRNQLFELDNMLTAFQIELWDYFRKPDKKKGQRKYMISTVSRNKFKKKFILKI